ncbi:DUF1178 family protein [Qipengyuania sp. MTN3-11]|uniref:DUF1178 family protein n=1 Tax=Qipengyuania sp. MTN3-11 TaxID=3056557 RepID=UPI0036F205EF
MIVFDLSCDNAHRFEGWFRSSGDFADQRANGLLCCPTCGSEAVDKAPMAPAVPAKGNAAIPEKRSEAGPTLANAPLPAEVRKAFDALVKAQTKALETSRWVGGKFAEEARSMHYGEKDEAPIHGRATREEAERLFEEGIAVAPLLVPIAPPDEIN